MGALLSITGLFGMSAYSASRRMKELGIRVALGAQRKEIQQAALGRAFKLLAIGSTAGLLLGILASRVLAFIVYQATSRDPLVLAGAVLAMLLLGLLAAWIPARRALSADPVSLLRRMKLNTAFKPNFERYEGVRPIQIYALRLGFLLVLVFVGNTSWRSILNHQGDWDPLPAAAVAMWASCSLLSLVGIFRPLQMLPLVLFEIGYKLLWLAIVARPLWSANRLAGSPAEALTYSFLPVVVPIVGVPWGYVFRKYIRGRPGQQLPLRRT